jgi:hypothetical protein
MFRVVSGKSRGFLHQIHHLHVISVIDPVIAARNHPVTISTAGGQRRPSIPSNRGDFGCSAVERLAGLVSHRADPGAHPRGRDGARDPPGWADHRVSTSTGTPWSSIARTETPLARSCADSWRLGGTHSRTLTPPATFSAASPLSSWLDAEPHNRPAAGVARLPHSGQGTL